MHAIETLYKGYKFRSRLEARYAVLFEALHFDWTYEPEGFQLHSGAYLPDFHIMDIPFWLEVKGSPPTHEELTSARELCEVTHESVWVCHGDLMHFASDSMQLTHRCFCWEAADDEILKRLGMEGDTLDQRIRIERLRLLGGEACLVDQILPGHVAHLWQRGLIEIITGADKMRQARFEHEAIVPRSSFSG